jgi:DNA modification methylase/DNA-directed RNA polymerase subunit RPC12/RpoP
MSCELRNKLLEWQKKDDYWVPKVLIGDVRKIIPQLPDNYIDVVVTSPPYWMQRDYGHPDQIGREETPEKYVEEIVKVFELLKPKLRKTSVIFLNVGYKYLEEELILIPEMIAIEMQKRGYMLKNKVIWYKPNAMPTPARNRLNNMYEPVLVFIKREGREVYYFNVDAISETPKTLLEYTRMLSLSPQEYLGLRVVDSLRDRETKEGIVVGVRHHHQRVVEILVQWDNNSLEWLPVGDPSKNYPQEVKFKCPICSGSLGYWDIVLSIANDNRIKCPHCNRFLGTSEDNFPKPVLPNSNSNLKNLEIEEIISDDVRVRTHITKIPRSSKYVGVKQVFTASPAGRIAVSGEYITIKRAWKVPQPLIAEYLNFWRKRSGVSIKEIDKTLGYSDTASHWFRKDFGEWGKGGSLPRPSDWYRLKEILNIKSDDYDRLVTEIVAEIQTVKPHEKGKNPGDVWSINLEPYPEAHFAVFPRELVEKALKLGCPPNGVVLDPFAGSGTVAEVAMKLGRKAILIELLPEYVELIKKRCRTIELVPVC